MQKNLPIFLCYIQLYIYTGIIGSLGVPDEHYIWFHQYISNPLQSCITSKNWVACVIIGVISIITKRHPYSKSGAYSTSPVQSIFERLETLLLSGYMVQNKFLDPAVFQQHFLFAQQVHTVHLWALDFLYFVHSTLLWKYTGI